MTSYESANGARWGGFGTAPARYAVRQVIDQELQRTLAKRESSARLARFRAGRGDGSDDTPEDVAAARQKLQELVNGASKASRGNNTTGEQRPPSATGGAAKRDFFGRVISGGGGRGVLQEADGNVMAGDAKRRKGEDGGKVAGAETEKTRVWVTFHEGINNAVRKPITLDELLRGL